MLYPLPPGKGRCFISRTCVMLCMYISHQLTIHNPDSGFWPSCIQPLIHICMIASLSYSDLNMKQASINSSPKPFFLVNASKRGIGNRQGSIEGILEHIPCHRSLTEQRNRRLLRCKLLDKLHPNILSNIKVCLSSPC